MWPDFLLFPCSKRGALEHPKFLPTVVLSLGVIFQDYLHQLLTCIKVIRAQSDDTCNTRTPVGEFILNPGNNLLHVALNKVLYVPFSEKEINSTEDYASSLAGHMLLSLFPLSVFPLTSRTFPFKKYPRYPKSDQKSFEDNTILHPTFVQHLAQQEWLTATVANNPPTNTEVRQSHPNRGAAPSWLPK